MTVSHKTYGERTMKKQLRILSSDNNAVSLLIEKEIETELSDDFGSDKLEDYSQQLITHEELDDMVHKELEADIDDIIFDALYDYMPPLKGHYCLSELDIYEKTEKKIRDKYDAINICAFIGSTKIYEKRFTDYIIPLLLNRKTDEAEDYDEGTAISRGLWKFAEKGEWQLSWSPNGKETYDNYVPILWFGIRGGTPADGWILNYEDEKWSDFWFPADEIDEWESVVEDCRDGLLHWMINECGEELPNREKILKKCPVDVDENDDYLCLKKKIITYAEHFR